MTERERRMHIKAHQSEIEWMVRGYRRLADALERDINDVYIDEDDGQFPSAQVKENGEWVIVGKLLDLARLNEVLAILRHLENDDGTQLR